DAARRGRLVRRLHAHAARAIRGVAGEPAQGCRGHPGRPRRPEHPARAADRAARRGAGDSPERRPRPGPPRGAGDRGRPAPAPVPALDDRGGEQGTARAELFFLPEPDARTPPFCDRAAATSPRPTLERRPRWYSARMPSIADTVVEMVQWVFPEHAGAPGQIHGGRMMEWITQAGTLAAVRVARGHVVLGAMDDIDFLHPVRVGQIAILRAQVEYVGTSSLEVGV